MATHKTHIGTKSMPHHNKFYQSIKLGGSGHGGSIDMTEKSANSRQVTFWAGLRVEGSLSPFGINTDDLTRWNAKINNGGLFEKIGNGLKK